MRSRDEARNGETGMRYAGTWAGDQADFERDARSLADQILKLEDWESIQICRTSPLPLDAFMNAETAKPIVLKRSRRDYIFREHTWVIEHPEQIALAILDPHEIREDKSYNQRHGSRELRVVFYRRAPASNHMAVVVTFRPKGIVSHSVHTAFPVRADFMIRRREQEDLIWRIEE